MLADSKAEQAGTEWCQAQIRLGWEIEYLKCQDESTDMSITAGSTGFTADLNCQKLGTTIFALPGTIVTKSNQYKNKWHT